MISGYLSSATLSVIFTLLQHRRLHRVLSANFRNSSLSLMNSDELINKVNLVLEFIL